MADQFQMGHYMDMLFSDEYIPEDGVDKERATGLQRQPIELWTNMHRSYLATGKSFYKLPQLIYLKLQAVQRKSYKLLVPEHVTIFTGEQHFDAEELDHYSQNRYTPEWNFKKGKYIRQIVGETLENLHDTSRGTKNKRCPWWKKHQGVFPSFKPTNGYTRSQKGFKRSNELWYYGGPIHSLLGPVENYGWSADGLSLQAEVPVPKFVHVVTSSNGDEWLFNGFDATDKGTMWITVAQRGSPSETPKLLFEKAKLNTLGWDYTGYHHLDFYEDGHNHNRVVSIEALIARHGTGAVLTEDDQQSYIRSCVGSSSDGVSASTPDWLRAMMYRLPWDM